MGFKDYNILMYKTEDVNSGFSFCTDLFLPTSMHNYVQLIFSHSFFKPCLCSLALLLDL